MHVARTISYERIGRGYEAGRRTDLRIAAAIWHALGDAETVLNIGAGTGSYEPPDRDVTAVEPSAVMRAQRPPGAARCIAATAESLPFADDRFDAAMTVLSDHHWRDPIAGLCEMRRVARKVVVFTWDFAEIPRFWLVRDYLSEYGRMLADLPPTLSDRARAVGASVQAVAIPWDCADGFFHAYWQRPHAYLHPGVRRATSVWSRLEPAVVDGAITALRHDLDSGDWHARNHELLQLEKTNLGARLLISETRSVGE